MCTLPGVLLPSLGRRGSVPIIDSALPVPLRPGYILHMEGGDYSYFFGKKSGERKGHCFEEIALEGGFLSLYTRKKGEKKLFT